MPTKPESEECSTKVTGDAVKAMRISAGMSFEAAARFGSVLAIILIAGCGEKSDDPYDRGYVDGYNSGQYDVCHELENLAESIKDRLRNCRSL